MLDILCVGDAKLDIFLQVSDDNPHFSLDKKENKLEISYGEKIIIGKHILDIGGNATNAAVGISRLGFNAGLCAEIGVDEFSQKILNKLNAEKIITGNLLQTQGEETSFSVAIGYKGDRTLFTEHAKRDHNFSFDNTDTKFVFLTSLGPIWETAYEKVLALIKSKHPKLAFNPGSLQLEKRDKLIMDIIENTDYLFVNKEEAEELLYGKELEVTLNNQESLEKKLLFGLKSLGAKNIVITDSINGSYALSQDNTYYHLGIIKVDVVEKTGAGDAYTAGFLSAILSGESAENAMIWGALNSANVIQKIGAEKGLLTKIELETKINSLDKFHPEII